MSETKWDWASFVLGILAAIILVALFSIARMDAHLSGWQEGYSKGVLDTQLQQYESQGEAIDNG